MHFISNKVMCVIVSGSMREVGVRGGEGDELLWILRWAL